MTEGAERGEFAQQKGVEDDLWAERDEFDHQKGVEDDCWVERGKFDRQQGLRMTAGRGQFDCQK